MTGTSRGMGFTRVAQRRCWTGLLVISFLGAGTMLVAGVRGSQGYLGIDVHDVSDDANAAVKGKDWRGAEIVRVDHDGPAGKAGLREHDVVVSMNGQPIDGEEQLRRMLRETPAGHAVTLMINHDGQMRSVTAMMANREEVERQAWQQHVPVPEPGALPAVDTGQASAPTADGGVAPSRTGGMGFFHNGSSTMLMGHSERGLLAGASNTGALLEALTPQLAEFFGAPNGAGLLVRSVQTNSPAAVGGLRAGDVVVKVNQVAVASGPEWTKLTRESKGRPVQVQVVRDKREQTLTITPDGKHRSRVEFPRCAATVPDVFA